MSEHQPPLPESEHDHRPHGYGLPRDGRPLRPGREHAAYAVFRIVATFFVLPCLAATVSLFVVTRFLLGVEPIDKSSQIAWVDDAFRLIRDRHVDAPGASELAYSAIRGMVSGLDGYSDYVDPDEYAAFRENNEGQYVGIGFRIYNAGPPITVLCPFPGSPAELAGLLPGDRIIAVDGVDCTGMRHNEVIERIKLENGAGQPVTLTVQPWSSEAAEPPPPHDVEVIRRNIEVSSVYDARVVDAENHVGYVRISAFQEQTAKELSRALASLKEQDVTSLIIDLRRNRGGLLEQAVEIASLFLPRGATVVRTEGRTKTSNQTYTARNGAGEYLDWRLAVLVDHRSASASEVVAGALKDHMRAILVGERTYGKGMVQSVIPCEYLVDQPNERGDSEPQKRTALLKITTSRYLTPSGRAIEKDIGLTPDVWSTLSDEEVPLLEQYLFDREISPQMWKLIRERTAYRPLEESRFLDRQLVRAIEVLNGDRMFNPVY